MVAQPTFPPGDRESCGREICILPSGISPEMILAESSIRSAQTIEVAASEIADRPGQRP